MKVINLQLSSIGKRPSVGFIPTPKVLYLKFHHELDKLKCILHKNSYPLDLVNKCIKECLDKMLAAKPVVSTVPKKNLVMALPYLGKLSLQISTRINRVIKNKTPIL